jgi:hypothetical protein
MTAWAGLFHGRGQPDTDRAILLRMHGVRLELQGKTVLDGLDLELATGEIHGLLGKRLGQIQPRPCGHGLRSLPFQRRRPCRAVNTLALGRGVHNSNI